MFAAGHEDAGSARETRSDGWPLGLQQPSTERGFSAPLLIPTPSETSESSSDLDTESTGSFFPERSHTLGSLIGIQMHTQSEDTNRMLEEEGHSTAAEAGADAEKRKSTSSSGSLRVWCAALLGCGGAGSNPQALGMTPSLAHLLEEERRSAGAGLPQPTRHFINHGGLLAAIHGNTLFDEQGILPPRPSGAPLKHTLERTSPSSSYLSADWNVFNAGQHQPPPAGLCIPRGSADAPTHTRVSTLWPAALCGHGLAG